MNKGEHEKLAAFLETLQHLSPHTRKAYTRDLGQLRKFCEEQNIGGWDNLDGRLLRSYIAGRHRRGSGGRTLQRNLSAIRAFYRYLLEHGLVSGNPAVGLAAPRTPRRLPATLDVDQAVQLHIRSK